MRLTPHILYISCHSVTCERKCVISSEQQKKSEHDLYRICIKKNNSMCCNYELCLEENEPYLRFSKITVLFFLSKRQHRILSVHSHNTNVTSHRRYQQILTDFTVWNKQKYVLNVVVFLDISRTIFIVGIS